MEQVSPNLPELVVPPRPAHEGLQSVTPDKMIAPSFNANSDTERLRSDGAGGQSRHGQICGCAPRTFWTLCAMASVVVIGAAVGGGVGSSLARKGTEASEAPTNSTSPASPSSVSTNSTGAMTATATPASATVTTTEIHGPSTTLLRDCPSSNNTVYNVTLGSSQPMSFQKACNMAYHNSNSVGVNWNSVNEHTASLDECINLCAAYNIRNKTEIEGAASKPCNAVCWRNTFDKSNEWPGNCFGFMTIPDSSNGFVVDREETICDSAVWTNQWFDK